MVRTINNNWIYIAGVRRVFENPDKSQREVIIREYLDPESINRLVEPQSGSCLRGVCMYKVTVTEPITNKITKTQEMSMEQLYDEHPWFFTDVRKSRSCWL